MTFKEYFKLTRITTNFCLKICGLVFSSIFLVIAILTEFKTMTFVDSIEYLVICILIGNVFGGFIWVIAINNGFKQSKTMVDLYKSIPDNIKERFGLALFSINKDSKYNFMEMFIVTNGRETPLIIRYLSNTKQVNIIIVNKFDDIGNFQNRLVDIRKRYKSQNIELTGFGLKKTIRLKDWNRLSKIDIENMINDLFLISGNENLKLYDREEKAGVPDGLIKNSTPWLR